MASNASAEGNTGVRSAGSRFDVAGFIDGRAITWREILMLAVCAAVLFIDGFDMFFVGKIAPAIARGLGEEPAAMRQLFVYQQSGMAIGAFLMPPLADRFGRKPVLMLCLVVFGVLSLWAVWSPTLTHLSVLRGFSGIFFSAMLPVGLALLSEMTPKRMRASFLAIALVGFSGGSAASGAVAAWLLDIYGWQIGFWIGGLLPLAALPLLLLIPESLAFQVSRNPKDPCIPKAILRIDPGAPIYGGESFHFGEASPDAKSGPFALFGVRYRIQTIILWCACFLSLGNIALLASWMPTFFQELGGVPIQEFAIFAMIAFIGGMSGTLSMGWLLDRTNPYKLIAGFFVLDAVALVALGYLPFGTAAFLVALIVWNIAQIGGQTGINTLATLGYPPEMRSSGIGWAGGSGRIGGIALPFFGGLALEAMLPLKTIMIMIAVPAVVIALLILLLGVIAPQERST